MMNGYITKERLYDALYRNANIPGGYISELFDDGTCRVDCTLDLQAVVDALIQPASSELNEQP
jgi:hypothetical protein